MGPGGSGNDLRGARVCSLFDEKFMARILVVEDDADNQELVTRFLKRNGHVVLLATDGMAGVTAAQEHVPDLILMDLGLPVLDGWEASKRIRSNAGTARIPIIALTAHALADDVTKAIDLGIDDYELKPVVYQQLMKKIAKFIK
jgi:two-component system, cell cycle response regulator DivK